MDVGEKLFTLFQDCNNPSWKWFPNNAEMMKLIDYLIDHGVTVQDWISVKDRLPDVDEKCLLCMENRITKYRWVTIGYFHTNYDEYVTHWQYLPQPPKGEEQCVK